MGHKIIYDDKHYQVQDIIKNPGFLQCVADFKAGFAKFGCKIPPAGFVDQDQFYEALESLGKRWDKIQHSAEYTAALNKITRGKDTYTDKELPAVEQLKKEVLPPVFYIDDIKNIAAKFGLSAENPNDIKWLENYIFFNNSNYPHDIISYNVTIDPKTNQRRTFVEVFGTTNKEDIDPSELNALKSKRSDYIGKNRPRNEDIIIRNKEVAEAYARVKQKFEAESYDAKAKSGNSLVNKVLAEFKTRYPELTVDLIYQIVNKANKM